MVCSPSVARTLVLFELIFKPEDCMTRAMLLRMSVASATGSVNMAVSSANIRWVTKWFHHTECFPNDHYIEGQWRDNVILANPWLGWKTPQTDYFEHAQSYLYIAWRRQMAFWGTC